jgi:class 3 adenylate cyclase
MTRSRSPCGSLPTKPVELEVGILFMDLIDSSVFASVLDLRRYAALLDSFHRTCIGQCRHFFDGFLEAKYHEGRDYSARIIGDELLVFLHSGRPHNDVYLLACLAATLKAAWLAAPLNRRRVARHQPVSQLSGGIHWGPVWAKPAGDRFDYAGYAINMAKRIEGHSRAGTRYRILLSDQAFKSVHTQQRNLLFGPCLTFESKGMLGIVSTYELAGTFLQLAPRLDPALVRPARSVLSQAIRSTTRDLWMHDFHQVWSESRHGRVTDEAMAACRGVLHHEARDPVALYYLGQGLRERGDLESARIVLQELTLAWPRFGDGHWELAKVLQAAGHGDAAAEASRKAVLLGIEEAVL